MKVNIILETSTIGQSRTTHRARTVCVFVDHRSCAIDRNHNGSQSPRAFRRSFHFCLSVSWAESTYTITSVALQRQHAQ